VREPSRLPYPEMHSPSPPVSSYRPDHVTLDFSNSDAEGQQFGFYDSSAHHNQEYADLSGTMSSSHGGISGGVGFEKRYRRVNPDGKASQFLDSKGFGWLLEVDDDDIEQKPLLEELDIDLKDIYYKVRCVLLPLPYFRLKRSIVRESPDFWGPLMVVLAYALLSLYGQFSVVSWILTIWLFGSFFVFFLARALGGDVGYTQVLGIVGYCLIPLVMVALFIPLIARYTLFAQVFGAFGVIWAVYSAGTLLCVEDLQDKRPLLLYPIFLLYVYFFSLYSGV